MESFLGNIGAGIAATIIASSAAMTGGITAGAGESVTTGDSYSSVQVTNTINANDSGGYSKTIIKTNTDGKVHEEVIEKTYPKGEVVEVIVATSSSSGKKITPTTDEVKAKAQEIIEEVKETVSEFTRPEPVAKVFGSQFRLTTVLSSLFSSFFSFWFK